MIRFNSCGSSGNVEVALIMVNDATIQYRENQH
jgi:hypothetical protein